CQNTNDERRQRRADNVKAAELLLSEGKVSEAADKFRRATSITSEIVESTIEHFRTYKNVDILVSPYESDAQLAFLVNEGFADVVVTEDSDLIAFGCEKIAFKWSWETGECTIYEKKELPRCFSGAMSSQFDFTKFRRICILSGCDYLQAGLPGIGLNKALSFFSKTSRTDLRTLLPRIPNYLNMSKLTVSKEFIEEFIRAENTFMYQFVRPNKGKNSSDYSYAGEVLSPNLAVRLALGNQIENSVIADKFFLPSPIPEWSVWCDKYESCGKQKRRLEEEHKREEKKCGSAFRFDSPSKKRAKLDVTIDLIDLEQEDDLKSLQSSSPGEIVQPPDLRCDASSKEKQGNLRNLATRPKSLKNEADPTWTVDAMMKMYGSEENSSNANAAAA
ncbi:XPG I-region, partial [Necator americanus]